MSKWGMYPGEWYPVFELDDEPPEDCRPVEFTDAELADLKRVEDEFNAWQRKIAKRFDVKDSYVETRTLIMSRLHKR